jgi:hypothetical protein
MLSFAVFVFAFTIFVNLANCEGAEVPFGQYLAERYYYSENPVDVPEGRVAPWPRLNISPLVQVEAVGNSKTAVGLDVDGKVHFVSSQGEEGSLVVTSDIKPLVFERLSPIYAFLGAFQDRNDGSETGVVTCSAQSGGCTWYACDTGTGKCVVNNQIKFPFAVETIQAFSSDQYGNSYLGVNHNRLLCLKPGLSPHYVSFGLNIVGNITAIALYTENNLSTLPPTIAVSTNLAVYYMLNRLTFDFDFHVLVGEDIDSPPSSLAFVKPDPAADSLEIWVGNKYCLNVIRPDHSVMRVSGREGLPVANITQLSTSNGATALWVASKQGLALYCQSCESIWRFFGGDRYTVSNLTIETIGSSSSGTGNVSVWAGTPGGVSFIFPKLITLEEKSAQYMKRVPSITRYRWVASVGLKRYGDNAEDSILLHDGDNDGLWTGMYVASQIFRYATTKEKEAKSEAWKYFSGVEFLHNVTGTKGFIARSAVRCGDPHGGGDSGICPHGSPNSCGWVNSTKCFHGIDEESKDTCCWEWKRDTSSDEVTGHFFTLFAAYEHLAETSSEKRRVANLLCDTAGYLVDGGLKFIDPISKKGTSWGYWDPAQLNGVPGKPNERGENSLEVLGFMAAAAKVCDISEKISNPPGRFGQVFRELVVDHHYDINLINALATSPLSLAFFDFRLAFMSYHTLATSIPSLVRASVNISENVIIPLNKNDAAIFKARIQQSMKRYFNEYGATVDGKNNRIPLADLVYRLIVGDKDGGVQDGLSDLGWQLRRYPNDLIGWPVRNSQRLDIVLDPDWARCSIKDCGANMVVEQVLPADEAFSDRSSDFVTEGASNSVDGGDGMAEAAPNPWLMVYWMLRFYDV